MTRFDQILSWVETTIAGLALAAAFVISMTAVILRFFDSGIFWAQEVTVNLIILSTFVGAVIALRRNEHVRIDILPSLLGGRGKRIFAVVSAIITLVYCAIIGGFSWIMVTGPVARTSTTEAAGLPLWFVQLGLVLGLTLMFVRSLELVYSTALGRQAFPEEKKSGPSSEMQTGPSDTMREKKDRNTGEGRKQEGDGI